MKIFMMCEILSEENAQTTQVIEVATSLKRFGHEILFFAPNIRKYTENKKFNIIYVPTSDIFALRSLIYQFFLFIYMLIYYLKFKPNLVYTRMGVFSITPVLFSKIFGLPHLLHLADDIVGNMKINNVNPVLITIYKVIEKISCSNSSRITTAHSRVKDIIHERNNILLNKIVSIPNGVNIDAFKPMSIISVRKELNLEDDKFYIVFVGGLDRWQGVEHLIKSAPLILKIYRNVRFLIVGDGYMREELINHAEKNNVSGVFTFTGSIPYDKVPLYINACDICVTLKMKGIPGSALKLNEYLACEKPVIATKGADYGFEILEEYNAGILVDTEKPEEIADAIITLLKNKELRVEMGKNGRKYVVENRSWGRVAREVEKVMKEAVK